MNNSDEKDVYMLEKLTENQDGLLSQWVLYNFLGWLIGVFSGLGLGQFYAWRLIERTVSYSFVNEHRLLFTGLLLWFPFGVCLASMQSLILRKWKIRVGYWIFTTAFAWAILAMTFSYVDSYASITSTWASYVLLSIVILVGGATIGGVQFVEMRKVISKPWLWVLANGLGLLALGLVILGITLSAFSVKSYVLNFLYSNYLYGFVRARGFIFLIVLITILPFLGTLTITALTGRVLVKYSMVNNDKLERANNADEQ